MPHDRAGVATGPWRLEVLRLWRTRRRSRSPRRLPLGFGIPVLTYYLPDLIKNSGNDVQIIAPPPTPADAITGFASNVGQLGTLVAVIVAAAGLAIDAHPGLAAFYRTRIDRPTRLVLPRYAVVTASAVVALASAPSRLVRDGGALGSVSAAALLGGFVLESLWFCFVTSAVAVFASAIRGVLGVVGATIGSLLGMALLGNLPGVATWLPTRLSGSGADPIRHAAGDDWHAVVVSGIATVVMLGLAVQRLGRSGR